MSTRLAIAIYISLLLAACQSDQSMTLDKLVERHTEARGGAAALEIIRSSRTELEISEPAFTVRGDYVANRDGYMRIDVFAGAERVFTEALGPDGGWQLLQGESVAIGLSADGEKALRRGVDGNMYSLHELPNLGYELALIGLERRGEEQFWAIDLVAPDGFSKRLYFDTGSYMLVREIETSALHPDIDSTEARFETVFSDFVSRQGITYPRKSEKFNLDTNEIAQTTMIQGVQINPQIDETIFKRPD